MRRFISVALIVSGIQSFPPTFLTMPTQMQKIEQATHHQDHTDTNQGGFLLVPCQGAKLHTEEDETKATQTSAHQR